MIRIPILNISYTPSVRRNLAILVVGCILPIAGVATFLVFDFYAREQAQLTINAISRARATSSVVDKDIATTQAALFALSTSPHLSKGDLNGFHTQAVRAVQDLRAESIVMLDTTGQLVLSTKRPFGEPLPKVPDPVLLKRMIVTGKPGISDLFYGPVTRSLIYTIAVPIKRDGKVVYSLNATVQPRHLQDLLTSQKLPDSWRCVITDSTGSIVARTHSIERFFGKKVTPDLLQRIMLKPEDGFESRTLEGIPVLTVYSRSPVTNWTVGAGMPLKEVTAGLRRTLMWLVIATGAALAIGFGFAWLIGGRIARSVAALAKPALALGAGEATAIPMLHFKEANELRRALIDAGTRLQLARYQAHHDALTDLPNRTLFHIVLKQQLLLSRRNKTSLAILYIDLDGFKAVNDTHGHAIGDLLLCAVSIRIREAIRDSDLAARLGGDEFAIALLDSDLEYAKHFSEKLIEIVSAPYQLEGTEATISASIGVAVYPGSAADTDTLLKAADHAMYLAKKQGKRRVCLAGQDR